MLSESSEVVRYRRNVLIVAHRLGFVMANAGIDQSNIEHTDGEERVLLLPKDPDGSAAALKSRLDAAFGADVAVIINDSFGRALAQRRRRRRARRRRPAVAASTWSARPIMFGRPLQVTEIAVADEIAAGASLADGAGCRRLAGGGRARAFVRCRAAPGLRAGAPARTGHVPVSAQPTSPIAAGRWSPCAAASVAPSSRSGSSGLIGADLTVIVNTGDDFEHLGLHVSPDIDTVVYTLAGLSDLERGWGRADESWNFMAALEAMGGETWFRLGDRDLAMHVERTRRAARRHVVDASSPRQTARRLGIAATILPMSRRSASRPSSKTAEGALPFQRYFVGLQCAPVLKRS